MSSELIKHVTDDSFGTDVLKADKPVLVDYWAEWCGPCKMIAPILDEVSKDYDGRLQIAKMNVDENREVPGKYGIRGIPTLMLFKGGELAATKVGGKLRGAVAAVGEVLDRQAELDKAGAVADERIEQVRALGDQELVWGGGAGTDAGEAERAAQSELGHHRQARGNRKARGQGDRTAVARVLSEACVICGDVEVRE